MERKAWAYIYIAGHDKVYFLEDFKKLFQVSRNTILDDMKKLKEEIKTNQLHIHSERNTGYSIIGNENDVRRMMVHFLSLITPKEGWYVFLSNLQGASINKDNRALRPYLTFDVELLGLLRQLLHDYEQHFRIEFTDDVLNNIVVWFHFFIKRMKKQSFVKVDSIEKQVIKMTDEYEGVKSLCKHVSQDLDITIPDDEIYYFAKYLLSAKVNYNFSPQLESEEMKALLHVVERMVADFQLYAAIEFREPKQMIQNLMLHLKPAYYRIKYGIEVENALRDLVIQNYPEVFHLTKKTVHYFEDLIGQSINENEVAFIAMHFGGWLRKEGVMLEKSRKRMLIVCTNGLGTSRLLESQLEGLFSDVQTTGVASLREYEKLDLNVDFVVSTIPLPERGVPVFVINPVLNNEDKEQLLKKVNSLFEHSSKKQIHSVETVMDIVGRYAVIEDDKALLRELRRYFHAPIKMESEAMKPNLCELLPADRIVLKKQVASWENAIKVAAAPLLKQGYIRESYISKMIENVIKIGPYIVISDYFALPHANSDDGVIKTGMSMLHLDIPVDLLEKTAKIIVVLASLDNEQHLKALSQLRKLFSSKEDKDHIVKATNKNQIVKLIRTYSTEMD
ncbi:BglG family transcription antiterminator [Virgibacillus halophilus]|uniref:BglG family transcription antiterminator n=1 Tax=Tigheibacillus halophilus TaxID=361280 RepID=UPI0036304D24